LEEIAGSGLKSSWTRSAVNVSPNYVNNHRQVMSRAVAEALEPFRHFLLVRRSPA
jgi:hypothetical protein